MGVNIIRGQPVLDPIAFHPLMISGLLVRQLWWFAGLPRQKKRKKVFVPFCLSWHRETRWVWVCGLLDVAGSVQCGRVFLWCLVHGSHHPVPLWLWFVQQCGCVCLGGGQQKARLPVTSSHQGLSFPSSLLTSARCSSKNGRPLRCRPGESFIRCFIFLPHPSSCVLPDACMCRGHIEKCMWWLSKISTSMPLKNGQCQELRGKKWNKRQKQDDSYRRI